MVSILPKDVSPLLAFGEALGRGLEKGSTMGFQKSFLKSSLEDAFPVGKDFSKLSPQELVDEQLKAYANILPALAPIPGAERYIPQMAQMIGDTIRSKYFSSGGVSPNQTSLSPSDVGVRNIQRDTSTQTPPQPTGALPTDDLPPLTVVDASTIKRRSPAQIKQAGIDKATAMGEINKLNQYVAEEQKIEDQKTEFINYWLEKGYAQGLNPKNQTGQSDLFLENVLKLEKKNPGATDTEIARGAFNLTRVFSDQLNSIKNLKIPSFSGAWASGQATKIDEVRQDMLKKIKPNVQALVRTGQSERVREALSKKGLTPLEIEELVSIPTELMTKALDSAVPAGSVQQNKVGYIENLLAKNLGATDSLLVARDVLGRKYGFSWKDFFTAVESLNQKNTLSSNQRRELQALGEPPSYEISSYFFPFWRWGESLKGKRR